MKLLKEFKEFAVKGNMMDMAIGIIIGASFNKVIDVLAKQVILPPLSLLSDGANFEEKKLILRDAITDASGTISTTEVAIAYGRLFEVFLDFLIIGFMGMAEYTDDMEKVSREFQVLNDLQANIKQQQNINLNELSIGMSNDYQVALKHNATFLRLGSVLFKKEVS